MHNITASRKAASVVTDDELSRFAILVNPN
jgi:hypothetical protein